MDPAPVQNAGAVQQEGGLPLGRRPGQRGVMEQEVKELLADPQSRPREQGRVNGAPEAPGLAEAAADQPLTELEVTAGDDPGADEGAGQGRPG